MSSQYPDFYIVGAPKCGTTALYFYLKRHRDVFLPAVKEPQYFCKDFPGLAQTNGRKGYLKLLSKAPAGSLTGEASVWYLYSERAAEEIAKARPDAKIIIMIREPIHAARSMHNQAIMSLGEDIDDFGEAWAAQAERNRGARLPNYCPEPRILQYRDVYRYTPQIQRYFNAFPREQIKVILFEDFVRDTQGEFLSVLDFLGLSPYAGMDRTFEPVNEARAYRKSIVMQLMRSPPRTVGRIMLFLRGVFNTAGIKPIKMLHYFFTGTSKKSEIEADRLYAMAVEFSSDIEDLEKLIGRDLSDWRAHESPPAERSTGASPD